MQSWKEREKEKKGSDVISRGEELTGLPNLPSDRRIVSKSQPFRDGRSSGVFVKKWRARSHLHKSVPIYERSHRTLARNCVTLARVNKVHAFGPRFFLSFFHFLFLLSLRASLLPPHFLIYDHRPQHPPLLLLPRPPCSSLTFALFFRFHLTVLPVVPRPQTPPPTLDTHKLFSPPTY